jgi:predicted DNA-binding transcriptional regulator AlpA
VTKVQPYHDNDEESERRLSLVGQDLRLYLKAVCGPFGSVTEVPQRYVEPARAPAQHKAARAKRTSRADEASYPPRGMRVDRAANYSGMSRTTFLELVRDGVMPKPMRIGGMTIWDRLALDAALDRLAEEAERERELPQQRINTVDAILGIEKK